MAPDAEGGGQQPSNHTEQPNDLPSADAVGNTTVRKKSWADIVKEDLSSDSVPAQDNKLDAAAGKADTNPITSGPTAGGMSYAAAVKEEEQVSKSAPGPASTSNTHAEPKEAAPKKQADHPSTTATPTAPTSWASAAKKEESVEEDDQHRWNGEDPDGINNDGAKNEGSREDDTRNQKGQTRHSWTILSQPKKVSSTAPTKESSPDPHEKGPDGIKHDAGQSEDSKERDTGPKPVEAQPVSPPKGISYAASVKENIPKTNEEVGLTNEEPDRRKTDDSSHNNGLTMAKADAHEGAGSAGSKPKIPERTGSTGGKPKPQKGVGSTKAKDDGHEGVGSPSAKPETHEAPGSAEKKSKPEKGTGSTKAKSEVHEEAGLTRGNPGALEVPGSTDSKPKPLAGAAGLMEGNLGVHESAGSINGSFDAHEGPSSTAGNLVRRRIGTNEEAVEDRISGTESTSAPESRTNENRPPQLQRHHHERHRTFAPLNLPLHRRLQTLAIFIHCSCLMFAVPFFLFLCSNPFTWPFMIPYLLHVLYSTAAVDGRLKYRSKYFRSLPIWTWFAEYFPAQLHKTHDLPPTRKYIFGYHPHGIISHGAFVAFATEGLGFSKKFPGITNCLLTLDSNFKIPLYREYVLAAGMGSVSKNSIKNILGNDGANGEGMGRGVTIVVGGARESLEAQPGTMKLILRERLGFVKMAIQTGADLVPVIGFGETDLYDQLNKEEHPWVHKFQLFVLRAMKFTLPFMRGRGVFNYDYGLMPYRRPLNIVVGKPIKVVAAPGIDGLDAEVVRRVHAQYVEELERLWETYKDVYMPERSGEMQLLV